MNYGMVDCWFMKEVVMDRYRDPIGYQSVIRILVTQCGVQLLCIYSYAQYISTPHWYPI